MKGTVTPVTPVTNSEGEGRKSQADRILEYLDNEEKFEIRLFSDQRQTPYIQIYDFESEVAQIHRVKSTYVKLFLIGLLWKNEEKAPSDNAIRSAVSVLMSRALDSHQFSLYNRVAKDGGNIWLDMCNDSWWGIKINAEGWEISRPPMLFRRYSHQKPVANPKRGGSITPLLKFVKFNNLGDQLVFLVNAVSWLIPDISHLICQVYGMQGGGKSLLQKAVKRIIDPSAILAFASIPRDKRELIRILDQHYVTIFDNISYLPQWASDVFCSAVTGAGQSYRELYTDSEEIIYEYRRCLAFNGLSLPGSEPDILDRSGLYEQRLSEEERLTESELDIYLTKYSSEILGGMLDLLVKSIKLYPEMRKKIRTLERLADFTVWGCAITEAMGIDHQRFLESYKANINNQKVEAINASPIADCLLSFFDRNQGTLTDSNWSGTVSQLFTLLKEEAKEIKVSTAQKSFPKSSIALGKQLTKLEPLLPIIGYKLVKDRTGAKRKIKFVKVAVEESFNKPLDWGKGTRIENYFGSLDSPDTLDDPVSESPSSLQNKIEEFLRFLEIGEKATDSDVYYPEFVKELVRNGWKARDVKRVREIVERDKMIFPTRPDYIKRSY